MDSDIRGVIIGKTYQDKGNYNRHVIDIIDNSVIYIRWGSEDTIMRNPLLRYCFYEDKIGIEIFKDMHGI